MTVPAIRWLVIAFLITPAQIVAAQAVGDAPTAVAKLYQTFAAEAVIDTQDYSIEGLFGRPKTTLARYLDDRLVVLVLADRACSARTHEVCNLDFSPMWDSQDPVGTTVKISPIDASRVLVELHGPDQNARRLTYRMVKTTAGWRVHDIEYDSHESLATMLQRKP